MVLNLLEGAEREVQSAAAVSTGDYWLRSFTGREQKGFNFCAQRFDVFHFEDSGLYARPRSVRGWREIANRGVVGSVVNGDVIARSERGDRSDAGHDRFLPGYALVSFSMKFASRGEIRKAHAPIRDAFSSLQSRQFLAASCCISNELR